MGECCSKNTETNQQQSESGEQMQKYPPLIIQGTQQIDDKIQQNSQNQQQMDDMIQRISHFPMKGESKVSTQQSEISQKNQMRARVACPIHQQKELDVLIIDKEILKCYQCIYDEQQQGITYDKQIKLNDFYTMSEEEYIKNFLKFQSPQINLKYKKWLGKEQEYSCQSLEMLQGIKKKFNQYIDLQIDSINQSMNRLSEKRQTLTQQKNNCNQLNSFKQSLSENTNAMQLEKNIQILFQNQSFNNTNFELELKGYCSVLKTEVDKQNNVLINIPTSIQNIFSQFYQDHSKKYHHLFSENLISDIQLFKKQNHRKGIFEINLSSNGYTYLKSNAKNDYLYLINHNINDGKKYEILMDLLQKDVNNAIELFLLPQSDENNQVLSSKLFFSFKDLEKQTSQISINQGKSMISSAEQKIENLKLQICLKDNTFRCKIGSSICSIQDWSSFQKDQNYFFAIFASQKMVEIEVILKYFKEVQEFESS